RFSRDWSSDVCSSDLEQQTQGDEIAELEQVTGPPRSIVGEPQDGITVIPVFTDDIGIGVVLIVMGLTPGVAVADVVPLISLGVRSEERRVGKEWGSGE